jgi:arsenite methyltransferase
MNQLENENQQVIGPGSFSPSLIKTCCAAVYDSEAARLLLGDSFHPGGAELTERLGRILNLGPRMRVLDVATGRGASAITLATRFECEVIGIDYSPRNNEAAKHDARERGLTDKLTFYCGDAERLPFTDGSFDAIVCECALCTFPNKQSAAAEFSRVLRAGGRLGLSDLTRQGTLPAELHGLVSWVACIADAQPLTDYVAVLAAASFEILQTEEHNGALIDFVNQIRTRLLVAEVMMGLNKLSLPGFDIQIVKDFTRRALDAIRTGKIGYAIVAAAKVG